MTNRIQTPWTLLPPSVTVVAVTKTFPFEAIVAAHAMGFTHIGENRVEEAGSKIEEAKDKGFTDIVWHMIGHVQSRKVKDVVELFDWVDSVDSIELAKKLSARAQVKRKRMNMFLQVNISGEKQKFGFPLHGWEQDNKRIDAFVEEAKIIMTLPHLVVQGLMTMTPYVENAEHNRMYFQSLRRLSETIRVQIPEFGSELSMGTSGDYQVAIEEGATHVRLGEALFGTRHIAKK